MVLAPQGQLFQVCTKTFRTTPLKTRSSRRLKHPDFYALHLRRAKSPGKDKGIQLAASARWQIFSGFVLIGRIRKFLTAPGNRRWSAACDRARAAIRVCPTTAPQFRTFCAGILTFALLSANAAAAATVRASSTSTKVVHSLVLLAVCSNTRPNLSPGRSPCPEEGSLKP